PGSTGLHRFLRGPGRGGGEATPCSIPGPAPHAGIEQSSGGNHCVLINSDDYIVCTCAAVGKNCGGQRPFERLRFKLSRTAPQVAFFIDLTPPLAWLTNALAAPGIHSQPCLRLCTFFTDHRVPESLWLAW